jgi:hypothetical protein
MALALRRTGSGNYPDWDVIGRRPYPRSPLDIDAGRSVALGHNLVGPAQRQVTADGRAATFEDAKAQFAAALAAFREWPGKSEDSDSRPADVILRMRPKPPG